MLCRPGAGLAAGLRLLAASAQLSVFFLKSQNKSRTPRSHAGRGASPPVPEQAAAFVHILYQLQRAVC